jgi:hypothetical protein
MIGVVVFAQTIVMRVMIVLGSTPFDKDLLDWIVYIVTDRLLI